MKSILRSVKGSPIFLFLLLSPYFVGFNNPPDSSWTEIRFAAGKGSYAEVSRDCEGNVLGVRDVPFSEAGAGVDHYVSILHLGLKGGVGSESAMREIFNVGDQWSYDPVTGNATAVKASPFYYLAPSVGLNLEYFGLDAGYAAPFHRRRVWKGIPTTTLRIGRSDDFHFRLRTLDDLPLFTGGPGAANFGFGFNLGKPRHAFWLGMGVVPYDGMMVGGQLELPLDDRFLLDIRTSLGGSESFQYGLSAGVRFVMGH